MSEARGLELKKPVGLLSGTSLIVGTMIGSGIFVSPNYVLMGTGSIGLSLVIWSACGLLALLGALAYAELGTLMTVQGGEYIYLLRALGPAVAFVEAWVSVICLRPASVAIMALSFSEYMTQPLFDGCGPPVAVTKIITIACLLSLMWLNVYSSKLAANVQVFFTAAKVLALLLIVGGGIYNAAQGHVQYLEFPASWQNTETDVSSIALSFYSGLWAYDGWNNLNYVMEEMTKPAKDLPRSILLAIPLVTALYLLVNLSYFTVLSGTEVQQSNAVAALWSQKTVPGLSWLITLGVLCSVFGSANGTLFTGGRLLFAAAREGHMPELMSMVHVRTTTPTPSLVFTTVVAIAMVLPGDISSLIDLFSFSAWLIYGLTMISLLVFRRTMPHAARPYKVPIVFPILVLLASCYLVVAPILQNPSLSLLWAALFMLGGLVFYFPFVLYKLRLPGLDKLTRVCQALMEVAPTTDAS